MLAGPPTGRGVKMNALRGALKDVLEALGFLACLGLAMFIVLQVRENHDAPWATLVLVVIVLAARLILWVFDRRRQKA